jgi:glycosyltransferase involved in cell wall biosynthesis
MGRRKVLLYSDARVYGGGERYLLELARGLPKDRYEVSVVTSEEGALDGFAQEVAGLGVRIHRMPAIPTLQDRGALLKVFRFFATQRPHVLHFNLVDPRACNGAMTAAALALYRDFVVTEHLPRNHFDNRPLPFRHRVARRLTKTTIVLNEADKHTVENRPRQRGRIALIQNGLADPGENTESRREAARSALGFPGHQGPIVGFVGRLIPQKNPLLLLEGVRRVVPARPEARFVVLGDGPDAPAFQAKIAELGLGPYVRWLGHRADARELVYGFDLLANTSRFEGLPYSLLEAMGASVPIIAPQIAGMSQVVADGASGFLVPPEDGDWLGRLLLEALSDPARLVRFGRVGRERLLSLFSLSAMATKTAALYDSI